MWRTTRPVRLRSAILSFNTRNRSNPLPGVTVTVTNTDVR